MALQTENKKIDLENLPEQKLVHDLEEDKKRFPKQMLFGGLAIVLAGILTGFVVSSLSSKGKGLPTGAGGGATSGKTVGSADTKTFPDSAEGELQTGGINGEGTHRLIRPGGESQMVYLTSTVLDLNQFVGKKVKVWGQTFSAKRAGWLMDVGRVQVL